MICPKCEKEFNGNYAKFCTECGTKLIKNRSLFEIPFENISQSKIDILIEQNTKIIRLLERMNQTS